MVQNKKMEQIFGGEEKKDNVIYYSLLIATTVVFFVFILLSNYKNAVYNYPFYVYEYEKNGVYEKFNEEIVNNVTLGLFYYLNNQQNLTSNFFSERDKLHLGDVKKLITLSKIVYTVTFILFILLLIVLYRVRKQQFKKTLAFIFIIGSLLYIILVTGLYINKNKFPQAFTSFHYFTFDNDNWQLDPAKDNLINLFPEQFWYDITSKILRDTFIYSLLFLVIGCNLLVYLYLKKKFYGQRY